MLCTTSIFHLCFISVDRYYAVCDPLQYVTRITIPVIELFLLISWSIPILFAFGLVFSELNIIGAEEFVAVIDCTGLCVLIFNKLWGLLVSFIAFFLPGMTMVGIYIHIFTVARKHAKQIGTGSRTKQAGSESKKKTSYKTESKATRTLGIVMGVFVLCWLPFFVLTITDPFINFTPPEDLYNVFLWLGYFNSAFNPIIYGMFYPWFRKALRMIVTGMIFRADSSTLSLFPARAQGNVCYDRARHKKPREHDRRKFSLAWGCGETACIFDQRTVASGLVREPAPLLESRESWGSGVRASEKGSLSQLPEDQHEEASLSKYFYPLK
ncbi:hypothetical protein H8959_010168 [Pygathrix nigripes]